MQYNRIKLGRQAKEQRFVRDTFEKVCRLTDILEFIQKDDYLTDRLALKGGTAINLTIFQLPRLSVDIDLDYCKAANREEMLLERERITERIKRYMRGLGYYASQKSKNYHALDSFVYEYVNAGGMKDHIKIEINYMLRCHVLPPVRRNADISWLEKSLEILCVDPIEIFGSKIVALLNRAAPRDLYDVYHMIDSHLFDSSQEQMLKKCICFYRAVGSDAIQQDFDYQKIEHVSQQRIKTELIPVLHRGEWFDVVNAQQRVLDYLEKLLVLDENEILFWDLFRQKKFEPQLLFEDEEILSRICFHPMAMWKCR